jgi:hypothetical protein
MRKEIGYQGLSCIFTLFLGDLLTYYLVPCSLDYNKVQENIIKRIRYFP